MAPLRVRPRPPTSNRKKKSLSPSAPTVSSLTFRPMVPPEEPATAQPHHEGLRADGHLMALPENLPPVDPVYANVEQVYYCG